MFKKLLATLLAVSTLMTQTAFASNYAGAIPSGQNVTIKVNQQNLSGKLKEKLESYVSDSMTNNFTNQTEYEKYITGKMESSGFTLFGETFEKQPVMQTPMTAIVFKSSVDPLLRKSGYKSSLENGVVLYTNEEEGIYVTYLNSYLYQSEEYDEIINVINTCKIFCKTSMLNDVNYSRVSPSFLEDNFLEFFLNPEAILDEFMFEDANNPMEHIKTLGLSAKQSNTGLQLQVAGISDIMADKKNSPTLHEKMPAKYPIIFSEGNVKYTKSESYQALKEDYRYETGGNLDNLLPLLNNEVAYLVQDSGEIVPALTLMARVNKGQDTVNVQSELNNIADKLYEEIKTSSTHEVFVDSKNYTDTINGSEVQVIEFNLNPRTKNPYAPRFEEGLLYFKITIGIVDDIALLSTNFNIKNEYGEGLQNNSTIKKLVQKQTDGIMYFSFNNLKQYLTYLSNTIQTLAGQEVKEQSVFSKILDKIFAPWTEITGTVTAKDDFSNTIIDINVDIDKLFQYYEELASGEDFQNAEASIEQLSNSFNDFDDVEPYTWYGDDVYYLTTHGVINGHANGTFKPSDNITRAEFLAMLINMLEENNMIQKGCVYEECEQLFDDVTYYDWYFETVMTANTYGFTYNVGELSYPNFLPNQALKRGEAAQIISSVLSAYGLNAYDPIQFSTSFPDVPNNHKYMRAIEEVRFNNVMTGNSDGTFKPDTGINRAEAAKVIRTILERL